MEDFEFFVDDTGKWFALRVDRAPFVRDGKSYNMVYAASREELLKEIAVNP